MESAPEKWINGFSKLSKAAQREWVAEQYGVDAGELIVRMASFDHPDERIQNGIDHFAENTIANYVMPLGIAPNFLIDGKMYAVPMAIEESSVVAAASAAAKFWGARGGFKTTILGTTKVGQLFFEWKGEEALLQEVLPQLSLKLLERSKPHTANMEKRGGGVKGITLHAYSELPNTFELRGTFETRDSMGANFINTILECWGTALPEVFEKAITTQADDVAAPRVLMGILSNYTPECVVRAEVSCHVSEMGEGVGGFTNDELVHRFHQAVQIARVSPYRATTHNKGIFNGIDAVVIATGNDFRAVEASGHAYAGRDGQYRSLSQSSIVDNHFRFWLDIPLALGTVGGLTKAHPLAATSLEILGQPSADELMCIVAATGLAQNFAAIRSLVTTGIQAGHMRMHLQNILTQLGAEDGKRSEAETYFANKTVSVAGVRAWLEA